MPFPMRRKAITDFIASNICGYVGVERSEIISKKAEEIMKTNVKERMHTMLFPLFMQNVTISSRLTQDY